MRTTPFRRERGGKMTENLDLIPFFDFRSYSLDLIPPSREQDLKF